MPLQDFIHKITEGPGSRLLTLFLVLCGMVGLGLWYDLAAFRNLSTIEGMDQAQLARNIASGRGFSTGFIRPFAVSLQRKHAAPAAPPAAPAELAPDVSNAPVYPVLLAGLLRLMPFAYPDTVAAKQFSIHAPDLWIALFNQSLFALGVWLLFRLARRLLDEPAAWVTAAVFAGSDLFWRFSLSGTSTLLLTVLLIGLAEVLSRIDVAGPNEAAPATPETSLVRLAALAGAVAGVAGLTRYSFALLIIPVVAYLAALVTPRRNLLITASVVTFLAVLSPWLIRNQLLTGSPLGAAGYAFLEGTSLFPGLDLERTLNPDFSLMEGGDVWRKGITGLREILEKDFIRLGGSWVTALFLAGLLIPFRSPVLGRLRMFVLTSLLMLTLAQALGRTGLSQDSPEVNSENLLVVMAPLVFLFGVSLFFMLLDQFTGRAPSLRGFAIGIFLLLASAPLWFTLFMPVRTAVAYPPYFPPYIQEKARSVPAGGWIMSDLPWAVSWYADRPSVWLSLKYREEVAPKYRNDFKMVQELGVPIRALYLSARTLKSFETQALAGWLRGAGTENWEEAVSDWDTFVLLGVYLKHEIPAGFPLKRAPFGLQPELFLVESERKSEKPIKGE